MTFHFYFSTDIDECTEEILKCDAPNSECINSDGSARCSCVQGTVGDPNHYCSSSKFIVASSTRLALLSQ